MSQEHSPENHAPVQEAPHPRPTRCRCHWGCALLAGLILGTLAAAVLLVICRPQYEAMAQIQVRAVPPDFLIDSLSPSLLDYEGFVNTQIALLRSPNVIDKTLKAPEVARLPSVIKQRDRRDWLIRKLHIKRILNSEIVQVSIKTNSAEESEKIVNAVVDAYFNFIEEVDQERTRRLLSQLHVEKRRQQALAQGLQAIIRQKTLETASKGVVASTEGMSIGLESVMREIALAETRLTTMQAQRRAVMERMENPSMVPISILLQMHPELKRLTEQREKLLRQRDDIAETNKEDDLIVEFDKQIERNDEKIRDIVTNTNVQEPFRLQGEVNLFQIDQEIRVQQIVVEELTKKYNEMLMKSMEHTENVLDISAELAQLERTNKNQIEDRIFAITAERRAPGQIAQLTRAVLPSKEPSWGRAVVIAGGGFVLFFVLPLLCMLLCALCRHCCRCCRGTC